MAVALERRALFIQGTRGARFALVTRPAGRARGSILYVPPFAEEMNKARRMAAAAAVAFAQTGWLVLQIDLRGCGDSAGELGEVSWSDWLDDIDLAWEWLGAEQPGQRLIWSLRAGGLLTADWLARSHRQPALLFWQPVIDGRQHLTQFLRLKAAGEMLNSADGRLAVSGIRARLAAGDAVEVAGYDLSAQLAADFSAARTRLPAEYPAAVGLVEVISNDRSEFSPVIAGLLQDWRKHALHVVAAAERGPTFWQTQEIEMVPGLIIRSAAMLDELGA